MLEREGLGGSVFEALLLSKKLGVKVMVVC